MEEPRRLESQCVNGAIVSDMLTHEELQCLECEQDLRKGGHLGTCSHSVMRGGMAMPVGRLVKCVSCGWSSSAESESDGSLIGATHLATCAERDDLRFVPWWTFVEGALEVGWHTLDVNEPYEIEMPHGLGLGRPHRVIPSHRFRFTAYADRELIGVKT